MGDNNSGADDQKIEGTEQGAGTQDESQTASGTEGEGEGTDTSENDNADKGDEAGDGDKKPDPKPTPKPADEEPKTRKRNVDFILERKNRKIEKLEAKKNDDADEGMGEDGGDDDLDPNDAAVIDKRVKAHLEPFIQKQMQDEDAKEIGDIVKQNPEFAPYADKVAKYAQHPSRKGVPIEALFYEVVGADLMRIGAERERKASAEARKTQAGGGGGKPTATEKSIWDLTPEEFALKQQEIRNKPRG